MESDAPIDAPSSQSFADKMNNTPQNQGLDYDKISNRLRSPLPEQDFEIIECNRCGNQFLCDHENLLIYHDPNNLDMTILDEKDGKPCPACGHANWSYHSAVTVADIWKWTVDHGRTKSEQPRVRHEYEIPDSD